MNIKGLYEFLLSKESLEFFSYLEGKDITNLNQIQAIKSKYSTYPVSELLTLVRLRKNAIKRIDNADEYLFTTKGVEQSSSSKVARYHAKLFSECQYVADLCCGNGIDLINIAKGKEKVYALDLSNTALYCSRYNAYKNALSNIEFINSKAEDFDYDVDCIFIDPDRRPEERRVIQGEDISPSFSLIKKIINKYQNVVVKLSPVFNYQDEVIDVDYTWEFISEGGVLKEILLCTGKFASLGIRRKAVILPSTSFIETGKTADTSSIKRYIYDLDPSIVRSGLVQDFSNSLNLSLINKHLSILTSDSLVQSAFIRTFEVIETFHYNKKSLQKYVKDNKIGSLVVKVRGFPDRPNQVLQKIKLKGVNKGLVYLIRMDDEFLCLVLKRL